MTEEYFHGMVICVFETLFLFMGNKSVNRYLLFLDHYVILKSKIEENE